MDTLEQGSGKLFTDPSSIAARADFRQKSRAMTEKVTTVSDAVDRLLGDGDYLAIGGFGGDRIPTAVVHEVIRQNKQDLGFAGHTSTHDFQVMCAGNLMGRGQVLARVDNAYVVGLEARGLSRQARRVMESGEVEFTEWSNYTLALRFRAAAMGVPFLPAHSVLGTDTMKHSAARKIVCPFTEEPMVAVPALYPDLAVIHVHESDPFGNCRIEGISVADLDVARSAKRLIITCERVISNDEIRSNPTRTAIPYYCVDAVCEVPLGSYPGNMPYEYYSDEEHIGQWLAVEEDLDEYRRFLDYHIFEVSDHQEYVRRAGGLDRLEELRRLEFMETS
ncbi:MAG TPA: CoA transferase subunit A [Planctomycetaceae bacterium]|nr:CoA transferase subunit A [Planctomycetaceae bacterium]HCD02279.1 CoA transferase subunit A [Planctomycetaceae bacterium]|tara:strand:+ start:2967 stop:3968 length:1002 start_codon:yes stop_codon:yes gene_type:complete